MLYTSTSLLISDIRLCKPAKCISYDLHSAYDVVSHYHIYHIEHFLSSITLFSYCILLTDDIKLYPYCNSDRIILLWVENLLNNGLLSRVLHYKLDWQEQLKSFRQRVVYLECQVKNFTWWRSLNLYTLADCSFWSKRWIFQA